MEEKKVKIVLTKPQRLGAGIASVSGSILEVPALLARTLIQKQCAMLLGGERLSRVLETPDKMAYTEKPRKVARLCQRRG